MTTPTKQEAQTVEGLVTQKRESLLQVAVPSIKSNFDVWSKRAIVEVAQNKELNAWILSSKDAQFQFITKLAKASQAGLQIGGNRPHCYFVNMGGQLRMDITKEGLGHAITYGSGAVLQSVPEIFEVRKKDKFSIDNAKKTFVHDFSPFEDRGEVVGWFTVLYYKQAVNGEPYIEIPFVTRDKVLKIKNGYSQVNSPAWKKSEEEMEAKIATKQLLKKPFAMAEGLAMMIQALDGESKIGYDDEPVADISTRASSKVDQAMGGLGENGFEADPVQEKEVNPKSKEEKKNDLF